MAPRYQGALTHRKDGTREGLRGRSGLAFAELTVLLFSSNGVLFGTAPSFSPASLCAGVDRVSLLCLTGTGTRTHSAGWYIAVVVLTLVASGLWPRWLCIPHGYIAFSIASRMTAINGGEEVAQIATVLLIPICLGDPRRWQWSPVTERMRPAWRGGAYAGHLLLRIQVAIIYLVAALSKLAYPSWRDGKALLIVMNSTEFGLPLVLRTAADRLLDDAWAGAALTWGVIAVEIAIAVFVLCRVPARRAGLWLAVGLHAAIILFLGLFSFGLVMISSLMLANAQPRVPGPVSGQIPDGLTGRPVLLPASRTRLPSWTGLRRKAS